MENPSSNPTTTCCDSETFAPPLVSSVVDSESPMNGCIAPSNGGVREEIYYPPFMKERRLRAWSPPAKQQGKIVPGHFYTLRANWLGSKSSPLRRCTPWFHGVVSHCLHSSFCLHLHRFWNHNEDGSDPNTCTRPLQSNHRLLGQNDG